MQLVGKNKLEDFKRQHSEVSTPVNSWSAEVEKAKWSTPHEVKAMYSSASILGGGNVVFNIKGRKYRIWVLMNYPLELVIVKECGTHQEYNAWKIV